MMTYSLADAVDFAKDLLIDAADKTVTFVDNAFVGVESVDGNFLYDVNTVHETEYPYRVCDKAVFLHCLPKKAVVLGVWKAGDNDVMKHLLEAMKGRIVDVQEATA